MTLNPRKRKSKRKRSQFMSVRVLSFLFAIGLAGLLILPSLVIGTQRAGTRVLWMGWISFWLIVIAYDLSMRLLRVLFTAPDETDLNQE